MIIPFPQADSSSAARAGSPGGARSRQSGVFTPVAASCILRTDPYRAGARIGPATPLSYALQRAWLQQTPRAEGVGNRPTSALMPRGMRPSCNERPAPKGLETCFLRRASRDGKRCCNERPVLYGAAPGALRPACRQINTAVFCGEGARRPWQTFSNRAVTPIAMSL